MSFHQRRYVPPAVTLKANQSSPLWTVIAAETHTSGSSQIGLDCVPTPPPVSAPERVTVCHPLTIPALLMEIETVPAITLETVNLRVFPEPDKVPLVAEPEPELS